MKKALILITIFLILGIATTVIITSYESGKEKKTFEREEWLTGTNGNMMHFPRLSMADDLIERKILFGLSKIETFNMLGEPTVDNKGWDGNYDIVYHLGPERGLGSVDSEWLAIKFDSNDKVIENKIVRD